MDADRQDRVLIYWRTATQGDAAQGRPWLPEKQAAWLFGLIGDRTITEDDAIRELEIWLVDSGTRVENVRNLLGNYSVALTERWDELNKEQQGTARRSMDLYKHLRGRRTRDARGRFVPEESDNKDRQDG
jgi:hypothetical protein